MPLSADNVYSDFIRAYCFRNDATNVKHYTLDSSGLHFVNDVTSVLSLEPSFRNSNDSVRDSQFHLLFGNDSGCGAPHSPFPITKKDFQSLCYGWQISPKLLRKVALGFSHYFEYDYEEEPPDPGNTTTQLSSVTQQPRKYKYLNIIINYWISPGEVFCLFRNNLTIPGSAKCLILTGSQTFREKFKQGITENAEDIIKNSASVIACLLASITNDIGKGISSVAGRMNSAEARLGISTPEVREWLANLGFNRERDESYELLNEEIHHLQLMICNSRGETEIVITFLKILTIILEVNTDKAADPILFQNIDNIIHRCNLMLAHLTATSAVVNSQMACLFNLINQRDARLSYELGQTMKQIAGDSLRDSSAMKTISILTLVFLPGTFVSAIFSTTIFDFTNADAGAGRYGKVAPAWWIYLVCCVLSTLTTVGIWAIWMRWRQHRKGDRRRNG